MKTLKLPFLLITASLVFCTTSAFAQKLVVHEWGTFTSLHGSDGRTLSGLYFEEDSLPWFVHSHPGFWPDAEARAGHYKPVKAATIKMETPVLYFYSDTERDVNVHVDFPHGSITQWYPERSSGEAAILSDTLDLTSPYEGSVEWNAHLLPLKTSQTFTHLESNIPPKWWQPRYVPSNLLQGPDGDVEKFLFYRGVADFGLPVEVKFVDTNLVITNNGADSLPFIYVYDRDDRGHKLLYDGPIAAHASIILGLYHVYSDAGIIPAEDNFHRALEGAGLTQKESDALLATWQDGYFLTPGLKIFWIVPRGLTDKLLPIRITPQPDSLERVLVGKTEILTPAFEKQLRLDYLNGHAKYLDDRYHIAYDERVAQLNADSSQQQLTVTPHSGIGATWINPTISQNEVTIHTDPTGVHMTLIRNVLGEVVYSRSEQIATSETIAITNWPTGLYFVTVRSANSSWNGRILR